MRNALGCSAETPLVSQVWMNSNHSHDLRLYEITMQGLIVRESLDN